MPQYDLGYVITLVTVAFGALMFSVLAVHLWRERGIGRRSVFAVFTLMCAGAFAINLARTLFVVAGTTAEDVMLDLITGMLPAVMLHVVSQGRTSRWRALFYGVAAIVALAMTADDAGLVAAPWAQSAHAGLLAGSGILGLLMLSAPAARQRFCYRVLLASMVAAGLGGLAYPSPLSDLAPDFLLLAFFCVALYYEERLVFFDVLIKRGLFYLAGLAALAVFFFYRTGADPLAGALVLAALWLAAPWVDRQMSQFVDRVFLGRVYSASDAERLFSSELQAASTEDDLRDRARHALEKIFRARAEVNFDRTPAADLQGMAVGCLRIAPRASGVPFMSDDRRLLQSLSGTLAVVLENVRYREREEQLRMLASRAELKALRAQINPHFLFNALNAIAGLIPLDPEMADRTIERLAQVFRYTLRKSASEWVRLSEEVEFVEAYLRVEQARFGDRLKVDVTVEDDTAQLLVPAMCIQPLVENALRHGVASIETRREIRLSCTTEGGALKIEVVDNGAGFPPGFRLEQSSGHGLRNIDERLRGYYGDLGRLRWESGERGTRVWLEIPKEAVVA